MKRIKNGKTYNTKTAQLVCEKNFYNNGNWFQSRDLYKTKKGTYFFAIQGNSYDIYAPDNDIEVTTEKKAKFFVEEHGNPECYIAEWGEPEEG